jgi:hypothetical protein
VPEVTPVLTTGHLNRALLARQLLLERSDLGLEAALEQLGGLQTQYSPSAYVGLWTRLRTFERGDLTRALEERRVVQATLMRGTIHLVSRAQYWPFRAGVERATQDTVARMRVSPGREALEARSEALRVALADGPRSVAELNGLAAGFIGNLGLWVPIVRAPPSNTWERRRADRLALAESWVGPPTATEEEGLTELVRAYLRAFGPAPLADVAAWAGVPVAAARRGAASIELEHVRDERGRDLVDLPGAPSPDPDVPAPVRFLPQFDNTMLAHARRAGLLPEEHRQRIFNIRNPFSLGGLLVGGRIVGAWSYREEAVNLELFEEIRARDRDALEAERVALEAFHR